MGERKNTMSEPAIESYDPMMRRLMKKGNLGTSALTEVGITGGTALEIWPGPGYLGIEWLTKTSNTTLKALHLSADMITIARRNAREFDVADRVDYAVGEAKAMPFRNDAFDAVFSNGSFHEWPNPKAALNEIHRVLKPGGAYYISDSRNDITLAARFLIQMVIPKERAVGFVSSLRASYTKEEVASLLRDTRLNQAKVTKKIWTIVVSGRKE